MVRDRGSKIRSHAGETVKPRVMIARGMTTGWWLQARREEGNGSPFSLQEGDVVVELGRVGGTLHVFCRGLVCAVPAVGEWETLQQRYVYVR